MLANRQLHDAIARQIEEWGVANEGVEYNDNTTNRIAGDQEYDETLVILDENCNVQIMYCKDHVLIQTNGNEHPGLSAWFWIDETIHEKVASLLLEWTE